MGSGDADIQIDGDDVAPLHVRIRRQEEGFLLRDLDTPTGTFVILIAQAIFSGGLAQLDGLIRLFAQITMPAYWALDGLRSTFHVEIRNATYPGAPGHYQPPILGHGGPYYYDLFVLSIMAAVFLTLAYVSLRMVLSGRLAHVIRGLLERLRKGKP